MYVQNGRECRYWVRDHDGSLFPGEGRKEPSDGLELEPVEFAFLIMWCSSRPYSLLKRAFPMVFILNG